MANTLQQYVSENARRVFGMASDDNGDYEFNEGEPIRFSIPSSSPTPPGLTVGPDQLAERTVNSPLPIHELKDQLIEAIKDHPILVVAGDSGCGKTTHLPQYLHEAGYTAGGLKIGWTKPYRAAAIAAAIRLAEQMATRVGEAVGYSVPWEDCTSDQTVVKYMSDEMLLRELVSNQDLAGYSCLVVDDVHERILATDILLTLVRSLSQTRPDFRLIISGATLALRCLFNDIPVFYIPMKTNPVDLHYILDDHDSASYLHATITTILQIHTTRPKGDVLAVLPSNEEARACSKLLQETVRRLRNRIRTLVVTQICDDEPSESLVRALEPLPAGARKVVLVTHVVEASIWVPDIVFVVDPGLVQQTSYDASTGLISQHLVPCSKASAYWRATCAAYARRGFAFRLYTAWSLGPGGEFEAETAPEIQRSNLLTVILLLKALRVVNVSELQFVDAPPVESLNKAGRSLATLGALDDRGEITELGRQTAAFPIDPMLARAILASNNYGCVGEVLAISAMLLEGNSLFYRPSDKRAQANQARQSLRRSGGDHLILLNVWEQWNASDNPDQFCDRYFLRKSSLERARVVRNKLAGICEDLGFVVEKDVRHDDDEPIQKAFAAGFFGQVARREGITDVYCTLKTNQTLNLHPSSELFESQPPFVLFHDLVEVSSKLYMRRCMEIQREWLLQAAPEGFYSAVLDSQARTI